MCLACERKTEPALSVYDEVALRFAAALFLREPYGPSNVDKAIRWGFAAADEFFVQRKRRS